MTTHEQDRARAVALIRELASEGHSARYIAYALTRAGIPTLCNRRPGAPWRHQRVGELSRQQGIAVGCATSSLRARVPSAHCPDPP